MGTPVMAQAATTGTPQAFQRPTLARSPRNASYTIDVRLDHAARRLTGRETIRWRNITSRPTRELQLHLYWNAWRDRNSTWLRERHLAGLRAPRPDGFGSIDIGALRVRVDNGNWDEALRRIDFIAPDDHNADDRTVVRVPLESPVDPGGTADLSIEWTARVPKPFSRTGYIGDYYFIGQWFPKLGVLEESGWNTHQFHSATEFFSDYGVYDVDIRVPRGFIVGATGCATTPGTTPPCSTSAGTDNGDGTTTHRFHAEDVHDFAWTASPDFLDLSRAFEHPALPRTQMRLLLQPEHRAQADRYFAIVADTLRLYGEWFGAYPYGYLTIVDPAFQSFSDGMEYPTLFTGRARWLAPAAVQTPEMTTAHEAGHQWWYAHGGQQRVRACLAGRGHQQLHHGAADGRGVPAQPRGSAVLRRLHSVDVGSRALLAPRQRPPGRISRQRRGRCTCHAHVALLALDGHRHHLQQDVAVAAHARAPFGLAHHAPRAGHLFRAMALPASEAGGLLRGGRARSAART